MGRNESLITKVTLKYDGSGYYGWQHQKGKHHVNTIEEVVSKALSGINKEETQIVASGRTDRGVHALAQVFHFDNIHQIPCDRLRFALNNALPDDIEVIDCEMVNDDFHARFSAKSKEYHYYLNTGTYDLFKRNYITYKRLNLDLDLMREACQLLIGKHDFTNFNTTPKEVKFNQIITITKFEIEVEDDLYVFKVEGSSFLRHMVRMLVGTVVYVGSNKLSLEKVKYILENREGIKAPYKIEANGLYLVKVNY